MSERVQLKTLRPTASCEINGHACDIVRQARRTTYVRITRGELRGAIVQLPRTQSVKVVP